MSEQLSAALAGFATELDACVHCGFCLPACPTYVRLGDEADSPRGRLHLMRAVAEGRIGADSDAFQVHLDRCLGCRACEPVCPSGVAYGELLEHARAAARAVRPADRLTRGFTWAFATPRRTRLVLGFGRCIRDWGVAGWAARALPPRGRLGSLRRALLMLSGSRPWRPSRFQGDGFGDRPTSGLRGETPGPARGRTALLEGCVQAGLFERVHEATRAVLEVNGFAVLPAPGQGCCGAIHAHAGDMEGARRLARINIAAFEAAEVDRIAVNAAGCGAAIREYGSWLAADPAWRDRSREIAERCSDVTELLEERGPVPGAPLVGAVVYHPPCHLEHAQGVRRAPRAVLGAIPGLEIRSAERQSECCGGAGIYGVTHPDLGGRIGADKARALADTESDCVATGNPGCMMQIAAFLDDEGSDLDVAHPVELLYESYRRAGLVTDD